MEYFKQLSRIPRISEGVILNDNYAEVKLTYKDHFETNKKIEKSVVIDLKSKAIVSSTYIDENLILKDVKLAIFKDSEGISLSGSGLRKKFEFSDDWGEKFQGKAKPKLGIFNFDDLSLNLPEGINGFSVGQPVFGPGDTVLFMGVEEEPRTYGFAFCYNRNMHIYQYHFKSNELKRLTSTTISARSPILSPDSSFFIFLGNPIGGPHFSSSILYRYEFKTQKTTIIVNKVETPLIGDFPGLFVERLSINCFTNDTKLIVCVDVASGQVERISTSESSSCLLDIKKDLIISSDSSLNSCNEFVLYSLNNKSQTKFSFPIIDNSLKELYSCTFEFVGNSHVLILQPQKHNGGPHSSFVNEFYMYPAILAMSGYIVALRSIGYGQKTIDNLVGIIGGSHGGFLGAFLTAKYPDLYKVCILRNPVIDISNNGAFSDIPDWSFAEAGVEFDQKHPPVVTPTHFEHLYKSSPISLVDNVKCPTLLLLGRNDRRVPIYQGLNWFYQLKSKGVKTKLMMFPDTGHSLDSMDAEKFGIQSILDFLCENMEDE
ncbi:alpha/beta-hydrolase [Rozella allomycis CSF55]|uniref:acylaminoacyl-peptidase n=1 Tax=Rozella allomycis (strain CSF55) TaxID=988480 RepID=A0A075B0Q6_ROZAC|nr:Peptidase S9, prolyl oligopeptidase, catalytic domain-containing protein [Rozella allomycis CSF55]RKP21818.1 alpha/beta-hydrolase [Rozella allomycis CSF55]|eukprot:EPZ34554.1 Peptidase S9, prolyl oligopeptidase, catalytic domain-containing protein [Rozella allomycis CSF55]